jgi:hypothetical protein
VGHSPPTVGKIYPAIELKPHSLIAFIYMLVTDAFYTHFNFYKLKLVPLAMIIINNRAHVPKMKQHGSLRHQQQQPNQHKVCSSYYYYYYRLIDTFCFEKRVLPKPRTSQ